MHTLILLRHAKADAPMNIEDHKRPLSKSGIEDASMMAERLKRRGYTPDNIISSDALRATTTADIFAKTLERELILNHELYNADAQSISNLIKDMDEEIKDLVLVGHNPTWEALVEYFTNEIIAMRPCSIVQISFDITWKDIQKGDGKVIYFDDPKEVR